MSNRLQTWEEAVLWLRQQPDQAPLVQACYFDDPLLASCERFAQSGEWIATAQYLPAQKGRALDIGAGRGISSYALAKEGWHVSALEPDASALVGAEAIKQVAREAQLPIEVVVEWGESLPFPDNHFEVVLARQVLHHARDLQQLCHEIGRVLKPNGLLIATREHVINQPQDLERFLRKHPLHHLYGGEHAYLLPEYTSAISNAGLKLEHVLSTWQSEINYFPMTRTEWHRALTRPFSRRLGQPVIDFLTNENTAWGKFATQQLVTWQTARDNSAGRLYSFIARK